MKKGIWDEDEISFSPHPRRRRDSSFARNPSPDFRRRPRRGSFFTGREGESRHAHRDDEGRRRVAREGFWRDLAPRRENAAQELGRGRERERPLTPIRLQENRPWMRRRSKSKAPGRFKDMGAERRGRSKSRAPLGRLIDEGKKAVMDSPRRGRNLGARPGRPQSPPTRPQRDDPFSEDLMKILGIRRDGAHNSLDHYLKLAPPDNAAIESIGRLPRGGHPKTCACQICREKYELPSVGTYQRDMKVAKRLKSGGFGTTGIIEIVNEGITNHWYKRVRRGQWVVGKRTHAKEKVYEVAFRREIRALKKLRGHPNVLCLFGDQPQTSSDPWAHIFLEYCPFGDVWSMCDSYQRRKPRSVHICDHFSLAICAYTAC
ncbi:hypothetical protein ABW19_dt0200049 [Dactylella cylindrospora]|nr:hypothetical protein ABW19_dt0200049 [Dactylella cylindrospora]